MARASFVANKKTGVVHSAKTKGDRCRVSMIAPENRIPVKTRQEAIDAGYKPCGHCFGQGGYWAMQES